MKDLSSILREQWGAMGALEIVAVILAVLYLLLVIRENIWCWYCAFVSSAIYVGLFIDARLYMESMLYIFYAAMAIYGWWMWRARDASSGDLQISVLPWIAHFWAVLILVGMALSSGYFLHRYTDAAFPYVDSLTTFGAVWATFLVARKVFENWWYWLAIDVVSIFVYWDRGLELTAALFVIYILLIPVGMRQWWHSYNLQPNRRS